MRYLICVITFGFIEVTFAQNATIRQRPFAMTPTWDATDDEAIAHRSPQDIMDEIAALDAESVETMRNIRAILTESKGGGNE